MSLLGDARRLAECNFYISLEPGPGIDECVACGEQACSSDCPVLALPRIVAGLEAAERLLAPWPAASADAEIVGVPAEAYEALVAALRGEVKAE